MIDWRTGRFIKQKKNSPKCPRCNKGGYITGICPIDHRPDFTCTHCDHYWTCGKGGIKGI